MHDGTDHAALLARTSRQVFEHVLQPDAAPPEAVHAIVDGAREVVGDADAVTLLVRRRRGRVDPPVCSDPWLAELEACQAEWGEGPGLTVMTGPGPCLVTQAGADPRWPRWSRLASEVGVGSAVAVPLIFSGRHVGSLTWYARRARAFGRSHLGRAEQLADLATCALATSQSVTGLRTAVQARHVVGMAQGIIMQRYALDPDAAFDVLRRYSSHTNVKLREVARRVIEERALPEADLLPD